MLEYYEIQEYVTEVAAGNYPFRVIDAVTADIYERGIAVEMEDLKAYPRTRELLKIHNAA
jgi:hypothetical protein|nr:MAG TPA: hypothetical protein [Caudoviricetes sp.]DAS15228.1 MAG TPA: hypothetical protein [Caudoviricetes sp.]